MAGDGPIRAGAGAAPAGSGGRGGGGAGRARPGGGVRLGGRAWALAGRFDRGGGGRAGDRRCRPVCFPPWGARPLRLNASAFRTAFFRVLDTTLTIIFYAFSGLAIAGSLAATVMPARRGISLMAVAVGVAGALASLSAGFAALLALVALGACALLIGWLPLDAEGRGGRA